MDAAKRHILRRLYMDKKIGESHTAVENLKKGVPSHMRGEIEDSIKELTKAGFILKKPTTYGLQVSLNPNLIPEVERILGI